MERITKKFLLNGYLVDTESGSVRFQEHEQSIEPKVMEVLLFLANNFGRVISVDELMAQVWRDSVVTPQSVQRCVAILRKVFDLSEEKHRFIRTHPKRGYELVVRPEPISVDLEAKAASTKKRVAYNRRSYAAFFLMICLVSYLLLQSYTFTLSPAIQHNYLKVLPFSSDPAQEFGAVPHHDNVHVAFIRKYTRDNGASENEIYIRNNNNKFTWSLEASKDTRKELSWSPDGKKLAVIGQQSLGENYIIIYSLKLDEKSVIEKNEIFRTGDVKLESLSWKNDTHLIFTTRTLHWEYQAWTLEINTQVASEIRGGKDVYLARAKLDKIAIVRENDDKKNHEILVQKDKKILLRKKVPGRVLDICWYADGENLLYLVDNRLATLHVGGEVQPVNYLLQDNILSAKVGSNGRQIYLSRVNEDIDLFEGDGNKFLTRVASTKYQEWGAVYAHNSEDFVFISDRSGLPQVWLNRRGHNTMLTHFNQRNQISHLHWAHNDKEIVFTVGKKIAVYSIDGNKIRYIVNDTQDNLYAIGYAKDGSIYYSEYTKNGVLVWRHGKDGGGRISVSIPGEVPMIESGGDIYFFDPSSNEIKVWLGNGETIYSLVELQDIQTTPYFISVIDRQIYYSLPEVNYSVYRYDIDAQSQSTYYKQSKSDSGWLSSISHRGSFLMHRHNNVDLDILVLE